MTGFGALVRFYVRRDRSMLAWWLVGIVLLYWSQAVSTEQLYATQEELDRAAATMSANTALIAMAGPARSLNTVGGQVAWQSAAFGAVVAGLMSMFLVGRHTRAEEESGRDELVRAAAIGRAAPLAATGALVVSANVVLAVGIALSLVATGLAWAGSIALGMAAGLAGLVFGAVTLVAAQLTSGVRGAHAITGSALAGAYVVRAVGDAADNGVAWLSPIGWGQYMPAFADESWWPAGLSVAAAAGLAWVAWRLFDRRDIGAGVVPPRPGPARAAPGLLSPHGLAWRLHRSTVAGWTLGMLLGGMSYGSIGDDIADVVGDSDLADEMFGLDRSDLVDSFYATAAVMLALIACGYAVSSIGRLRSEESDGRASVVLATAVGRARWAASHLLVTLGGSLATVVLAGVGLGLGFTLVTGDGAAFGRLVAATLPHVVPVLVVAGVGWLGYTVRPALVSVGWVLVAWSAVVLMFGATLRMPQWLRRTSPFEWLPRMPAEPFDGLTLAGLSAVAAALVATGFVALRVRDVG